MLWAEAAVKAHLTDEFSIKIPQSVHSQHQNTKRLMNIEKLC